MRNRYLQHLPAILAVQNQARERGWFSIQNLAEGEAEVFIYGVIGASFFEEGVEAGDFVQQFRDIQANKIIVRINSPGGNVDDAVAIHNAIRQRSAITETHIDGHALSASGWVGLAANKVIMRPHSRMMIHEPHGVVIGDPAEFRKRAEVFDGVGNDIADILAEKAGGNRDEWRERMREETWYGDQEAVDAGLADVVDGAASGENTFDLSILGMFRNAPGHLTKKPEQPEPTPGPDGQEPPQELVRAALAHQRNRTRELGVSV